MRPLITIVGFLYLSEGVFIDLLVRANRDVVSDVYNIALWPSIFNSKGMFAVVFAILAFSCIGFYVWILVKKFQNRILRNYDMDNRVFENGVDVGKKIQKNEGAERENQAYQLGLRQGKAMSAKNHENKGSERENQAYQRGLREGQAMAEKNQKNNGSERENQAYQRGFREGQATAAKNHNASNEKPRDESNVISMVKRSFARKFHPDNMPANDPGRAFKSAMFAEFWDEIQDIEKQYKAAK